MPKLLRLRAREIRQALARTGSHLTRQRGSHLIPTNPATGHVAVVPDYGSREVPIGALRASSDRPG
ncbi:MAG: addiction module toxin, HicA family [Armatimonadetes bacterium]|nr:addiction module toxin, HicA family [Armatimonadota bacterium]